MSSPSVPGISKLQVWLILIVASIGFAFDTYELLMLPVIAGPAFSELLGVPPSNPAVGDWISFTLWMAALSGGIFGLLGGWLTDRFGRKRVMVASIMVYSVSPVFAAFSTSAWMLLFFRCTTFIGVCVEFVAAITWLAELFPGKRQKELALGITQAFASVGGLLVTGANMMAVRYADLLPAIPVPEPFDPHASWRYTLITGLLPAIPIALLLPFVPESPVWAERKRSGTLRRPRIRELFAPDLRRITIVTALLSACAYAAAFGALQLTPSRIVPGLPDLAEQRATLKPLQEAASELNAKLTGYSQEIEQFKNQIPGLAEVIVQRDVAIRDRRKAAERKNRTEEAVKQQGAPATEEQSKTISEAGEAIKAANGRLAGELMIRLNETVKETHAAREAVVNREATLVKLAANRAQQKGADDIVKERGNDVQLYQELGGLTGRIALAVLILVIVNRRLLLWMFQVPGLVMFPLVYFYCFKDMPGSFALGMAVLGFLTVAQFSYFGEYLPKVFPVHLRGTGASFATNVGGRMIGTMAAVLNTKLLAPLMPGNLFAQVAAAAAVIGASVFLVGFIASMWLPQPKEESHGG